MGLARLGRFVIEKLDTERRLVSGWASVIEKADGTPVVDLQGDVIDGDAVKAWEDAFIDYSLFRGDGDVMHQEFEVAKRSQLFLTTKENQQAMGIPPGHVPVGAWVQFKFLDTAAGREAWDGVKSGKLRAFSIVGKGERQEIA